MTVPCPHCGEGDGFSAVGSPIPDVEEMEMSGRCVACGEAVLLGYSLSAVSAL